MPDGSTSLEERIVDQFLNNLESSEEISDDVSGVIDDLSEKSDFGGRDEIKALVLEAVDEDED